MNSNAWKMCFQCIWIVLHMKDDLLTQKHLKISCSTRNDNIFGFFLPWRAESLQNIDHVILWLKHSVVVFIPAKISEGSFLGLDFISIIWTAMSVNLRKPRQRDWPEGSQIPILNIKCNVKQCQDAMMLLLSFCREHKSSVVLRVLSPFPLPLVSP